ncbi:MAG TPA: MOSC domain-containing protein [Candidatus Thermoplasmatota archaeon]|nr:MOSC domain-containing protein [Candidatus Thermoplasmatota archaeon]
MAAARIFQLNVSPGGVPKRAVAHADLTPLGLAGDSVKDTRHHGGPDRALCLYALERILALQEEGATIFPGAIGENVTTVGLDWGRVVPGARMSLGPATIEITKYAVPCKITSPFVGGNVKLYAQDHRPGWSRVYARVLQEGRLEPGQRIELL